MARRTSKRTAGPLAGLADPTAPLDAAAFLDAARKACAALGEDLLARADGSAGVTEGLRARWADEAGRSRTADTYEVWRRRFVGQVAAAWVLSVVFVRTLEDRGALGRAWVAGPGALDRQKQFFELCPYLTEREYLLTVFRELSKLPGSRQVFDADHNPVWRLAPSAEGARRLLGLFREPEAETPGYRFGQSDTRFLGDLYQDLDDEVKSRYALLQTPRFVESFILDRTLDPAIEHFGLDGTTLIDPTCGSGHFLLGAFERLFDRRLTETPGISQREAARLALDAVYGVDINPYAVAIARFRLTLAYMDKAGFHRIGDVPEVPMHLVVADSLLHGEAKGQRGFADLQGQAASAWKGEEYALEDEDAAKLILNKRYAAVVGNPPYIVPQDSVLKKRYAEIYRSAYMKYAMSAPFAERFFGFATMHGMVGMITANSFTKREFGKRLIQECLPRYNLELIVNTSGAYIPGHGTPTVLIFGRSEPPGSEKVRAVLSKRGEPSTPDDPSTGLVWRSIAEHWREHGFENEYVSVAELDRTTLSTHPWSLGGGGAGDLKLFLEDSAGGRLREQVSAAGFSAVIGEDDAFIVPRRSKPWEALPTRALVIGESVRDWVITSSAHLVFPFESHTLVPTSSPAVVAHLWPYRRTLELGIVSGSSTMKDLGRAWFDLRRLAREKLKTPFSIVFAEVSTHNHFALDRGGRIFKQTAPLIKLSEAASEEAYLATLSYLNSSTACFWMKQVCTPKSNHTEDRPEKGIPDWERYAFSSTALLPMPLPEVASLNGLLPLGREQDALAQRRSHLDPEQLVATIIPSDKTPGDVFAAGEAEDLAVEHRMVAVQEDIDWAVYAAMGLCEPPLGAPMSLNARMASDERPFQREEPPPQLSTEDAAIWRARRAAIQQSSQLQLVESLVCKRKWMGGARGSFALRAMTYAERAQKACRGWLATRLEDKLGALGVPGSLRDLLDTITTGDGVSLLEYARPADMTDAAFARELLEEEAVPYLGAYRYTDTGLEKRAAWERTWDLQRREDAGEAVGGIPVPPKYDSKDYRDPVFWRLRGKLDVPKERFIAYPACESDEDASPVYGWAGWNHREQAQALAALYQKRKTEEGWGADRLTPMLAGLDELVPWVKQWHNEPSEEFGGLRLGDYFGDFVAGECRELGLTVDDLRAWRPVKKGRGAGKKAAVVAEGEGEKAPKRRGRKKKAAEGEE